VINKFRGDPAILGSGMQSLEKLTGVPFWAFFHILIWKYPLRTRYHLVTRKLAAQKRMSRLP